MSAYLSDTSVDPYLHYFPIRFIIIYWGTADLILMIFYSDQIYGFGTHVLIRHPFFRNICRIWLLSQVLVEDKCNMCMISFCVFFLRNICLIWLLCSLMCLSMLAV